MCKHFPLQFQGITATFRATNKLPRGFTFIREPTIAMESTSNSNRSPEPANKLILMNNKQKQAAHKGPSNGWCYVGLYINARQAESEKRSPSCFSSTLFSFVSIPQQRDEATHPCTSASIKSPRKFIIVIFFACGILRLKSVQSLIEV